MQKCVRHHDFVSDHKTFNNKARIYGVSTGNVVSGTQNSTYVRAHSEIECNGFTNPPGHLRAFDLKTFNQPSYSLDWRVRNWLDANREIKCIVYCLRTHRGDNSTVHGWIITSADDNYELLARCDGRGAKNRSVVDEAINFLTGRRHHFSADIICDTEEEVRQRFQGEELEIALEIFRKKQVA